MAEPVIHCKYDSLEDPKTLKPHPKNPNRHDKSQIERLAKIIEGIGFRQPIIVSRNSGCVVVGHGRLEASRLLKLKAVPVTYQEFETADVEYNFLVADNAIASWAELDLSSINTDLADLGPDFDIDMLGIRDFVLEPSERLGDSLLGDKCPTCGRKQKAKPC